MYKFLSVIAIMLVTSVAHADVFDIPAGPYWTKVQDGEIIQWSVIPEGVDNQTRLDLLSYVEDDVRTTYYLIRRKADNGKMEVYTVSPVYKLGIGLDRNGKLVATPLLQILLDMVDRLPTEAAALLPK